MDNFKRLVPYIVMLVVSSIVLLQPLGNSDELWNYNFAINVLRGNVPYKDFSIVQTPLSCYLAALFLLVFGEGLFAFKILTYILLVGISFMVFHLCEKTTKKTGVALCATAITMGAHYLCFIYNYNYLTVLVLLIIFELELSEKKSLKKNLLIGLLIGATILIKQNTGLMIWIANILICFRAINKHRNDKRYYICRLIVSNIPLIVYAGYLAMEDAFDDFMEYAIHGITTFTHRYTLVDLCVEATIFVPYAVLIFIIYILIGKKVLSSEITDYQFSVLGYAVAWTSIIYPLADAYHVLLVLIPLVPVFCSFYKFDKINQIKRLEVPLTVVIIIFCFHMLCMIALPVSVGFNVSKLDNYKGILIDKGMEQSIKTVDDYILQKEKEGHRVRIANSCAAAYMIPINHYEKNWDMLLVGNIGSYTVQELLESDRPTLYLLIKDESLYGLQEHYELLDYIKENYTCIDEIEGFGVYYQR